MRFYRTRKLGPFEDTNRKRAYLARKQRLEREAQAERRRLELEALPLFSEQIATEHAAEPALEHPDADTVMAHRAVAWDQYQQQNRDEKAARWREARRRLSTFGDNVRPILRKLWNEAPYPGDPGYLLSFLHSYDVGRIDVDNPPWVYRGPGLNKVDLLPIINASRARMGMPPIERLDQLTRYGSAP
jgi:hypothetical protein